MFRIAKHETAGALKKLLADVPDDLPVLVPAFDHGYRTATGAVTTALVNADGEWTEDHGEDLTPEAEWGKRTHVLVID